MRKRVARSGTVIFALTFISLTFLSFPSTATGTDLLQHPADVASALIDALNSYNVEGAAALFDDRAVIVDLVMIACPRTLSEAQVQGTVCAKSRVVFPLRSEVRAWVEQVVRSNIQVREVGGYRVTGSNVTWGWEVTVDEYRRLNIDPLEVVVEAGVEGGKIRSLTILPTSESAAKLASVVATRRSFIGTILVGVAAIVFVLVIFFTLRVRKTFAGIPRLSRPWTVLEIGVILLFVGVLFNAFLDLTGISLGDLDTSADAFVAVAAMFILAGMILMKRAWTVPSE